MLRCEIIDAAEISVGCSERAPQLLPASTSLQPFPSEIFGMSPGASNFQGRLPRGTPAHFCRLSRIRCETGAQNNATGLSHSSIGLRAFGGCLGLKDARQGPSFRDVVLAELNGTERTRRLNCCKAEPPRR